RALAVVRAAERGPAAADAVHPRGGHRTAPEAERLATLPDQAVVLVEEPLLADVDAQLPLDRLPVRVQLRRRHPLEAVLGAPALEPVRRRAERVAPVVDGAAAHGLGIGEEHGVVVARVQAAPAVERGHGLLFPLGEVLRAEEAALLQHDHVPAAIGQVGGKGAAPRAGPDHDHVRAVLHIAAVVRALDDHRTSPKSTGYGGIGTPRSGHVPSKPVSGRVTSWLYEKK